MIGRCWSCEAPSGLWEGVERSHILASLLMESKEPQSWTLRLYYVVKRRWGQVGSSSFSLELSKLSALSGLHLRPDNQPVSSDLCVNVLGLGQIFLCF
jgi:hypothetical protein